MNRSALVLALALAATSAFADVMRHAALAYSHSTQRYAVSGGRTYREAYDEAMRGCGVSDCFVRASVTDGCVAFARDAEWRALGFASGATPRAAEDEALFLCERPWPNGCRLVISFCSQFPME